jgi:hypothetical protein
MMTTLSLFGSIALAVLPATIVTVTLTPQRVAQVSWSDGTSDARSWVSVVPAGTADGQHAGQWTYTQGALTGRYDSAELTPGEYEARFYADGGYGKLVSRKRFTVLGLSGQASRLLSVGVSTTRKAVVSWKNGPSDTGAWVSVVPAGTTDDQHAGKWMYTKGVATGTYETETLASGEYEARLYGNDGYKQLIDRMRFYVAVPAGPNGILTVGTTPERHAAVSWNKLTPEPNSWISVVPAGTPDGQHAGRWIYTKGNPTGTYDSGELPAGEYEARFYDDGAYGKLISRMRFTIAGLSGQASRILSVEITPSRTALVRWANGTPDTKSWVSVVPLGTSDSQHAQKWTYTQGTASGQYDSPALAPGEYEARFYADGGYSQLIDRIRFYVGATATTGMLSVDATAQRNAVVTWTKGTQDPRSWVSVVPAGTSDAQHVGKWIYTQGTPTGKYESGPLTPGEYEARFYADGGYGKLVDRLRFTVK